MSKYISLLRGINVGGQKIIKMTELASLYQSLGLTNVITYIQSGNVLFNSKISDTVKLSSLVKTKIKKEYGFDVPVLILSIDEMRRIIYENPFADEHNEDAEKLHVTILSAVPDLKLRKEFKIPESPNGEMVFGSREIYLFCQNGYGKTKLTNDLFEKKLNLTATTRNWKTMNILSDMAG